MSQQLGYLYDPNNPQLSLHDEFSNNDRKKRNNDKRNYKPNCMNSPLKKRGRSPSLLANTLLLRGEYRAEEIRNSRKLVRSGPKIAVIIPESSMAPQGNEFSSLSPSSSEGVEGSVLLNLINGTPESPLSISSPPTSPIIRTHSSSGEQYKRDFLTTSALNQPYAYSHNTVVVEGKTRDQIMQEAMMRDNICIDIDGNVCLMAKAKDCWVHDKERPICGNCLSSFTLFNRRHHCRACAEIYCGTCSSTLQLMIEIPPLSCASEVLASSVYLPKDVKSELVRCCRKCETKLNSWNSNLSKLMGITSSVSTKFKKEKTASPLKYVKLEKGEVARGSKIEKKE